MDGFLDDHFEQKTEKLELVTPGEFTELRSHLRHIVAEFPSSHRQGRPSTAPPGGSVDGVVDFTWHILVSPAAVGKLIQPLGVTR